MSDYKTIHGFTVKSYTTDPDNLIQGQVWYDKTNEVLQLQAAGAGAWSTGNNINTGRDMAGGAGIQTAAIISGGGTPAGPNTNATEIYNGTNWTEVNNLNTTRRQLGGAGTSTVAIVFGGDTSTGSTGQSATTEAWNGSTWTEVNDLNTAKQGPAGAGTSSSAAISIGGGVASEG